MTLNSLPKDTTSHILKPKILDIGCGKRKVTDSIGVDIDLSVGADVVHNLNQFPYPFEQDEFDEVHIRETLCVLDYPISVMEEVYRILKNKGKVIVAQPYFRSVWNYVDPQIKHFGTAHSFAFYDPDDAIRKRYGYHTEVSFRTLKIIFEENNVNPRPIRRLIIWLANRGPRKYEVYLSHLFPLDSITYYLEKI